MPVDDHHLVKCNEKCVEETNRFRMDPENTSFVQFGQKWDADRRADTESKRCFSFCVDYIENCANKSSENESLEALETSGTPVDNCSIAKQRWANYLFVTRNRPATVSFASGSYSPLERRGKSPNDAPEAGPTETVGNGLQQVKPSVEEYLRKR